MDLNTKIIKGVRQFPSLYDNKGNLDERNQAWMQLAEKLKMHGSILNFNKTWENKNNKICLLSFRNIFKNSLAQSGARIST